MGSMGINKQGPQFLFSGSVYEGISQEDVISKSKLSRRMKLPGQRANDELALSACKAPEVTEDEISQERRRACFAGSESRWWRSDVWKRGWEGKQARILRSLLLLCS